MKNKPDLSDDEIRSYMDFDKLLQARNHAMPFIGRTKLILAIVVVLISTGFWLYFEMSPMTANTNAPNLMPKAPSSDSPAVVHSDSLTNSITDSSDQPNFETVKDSDSDKSPKAKKDKTRRTEVLSPPQNNDPNKSTEESYREPEPENGYPNFYEYLNNNLKYPSASRKDSIQGVETISFTINAQGRPENIEIRQSLGKAFDEESLRVIKEMPAWKPAILNGKPVASRVSIPLTFHMERIK